LQHDGDPLGPVAEFDRQRRVPLRLFERLPAPLPSAVERQREALALKRLGSASGSRSSV